MTKLASITMKVSLSDVPIPSISLRLLRSVSDNMITISDGLGAVTLPPVNASRGEVPVVPPIICKPVMLTFVGSTLSLKERDTVPRFKSSSNPTIVGSTKSAVNSFTGYTWPELTNEFPYTSVTTSEATLRYTVSLYRPNGAIDLICSTVDIGNTIRTSAVRMGESTIPVLRSIVLASSSVEFLSSIKVVLSV